jgi:hypothetical protein
LLAASATLTADIAGLIGEFAPKCLKLAALRDQIRNEFPWNVDRFAATMTGGAQAAMLVRLELYRQGLAWAVGDKYPFGIHTVKPITERIREADALLNKFIAQGGVDGAVPVKAPAE